MNMHLVVDPTLTDSANELMANAVEEEEAIDGDDKLDVQTKSQEEEQLKKDFTAVKENLVEKFSLFILLCTS